MMKSEDRLIKIGEKISIIFEDASSFYNPNQLIVTNVFSFSKDHRSARYASSSFCELTCAVLPNLYTNTGLKHGSGTHIPFVSTYPSTHGFEGS